MISSNMTDFILTKQASDLNRPPEAHHRSRHKKCPLLRFNQSSLLLANIFVIILTVLHHATITNSLREPRFHEHSGNRCHSGWTMFGQKCYKVTYSPRNLEIAKTRCQDLSGQLALVEDETAREEESTPGFPSNSSVFTFLTSIIKSDSSSLRFYYVNLSADLLRQYKLMAQQEAAVAKLGAAGVAGGGDLSEHTDLDFASSDLWLPNDDRNLTSTRFNSTSGQDAAPGFVLAFSRLHGRWGLLPVSPSRKAASICEMPNSAQTQRPDDSRANHEQLAAQPSHQQSRQTPTLSVVTKKTDATSETSAEEHRAASDLVAPKRGNEKEAPSGTSGSGQADQASSALFRDIPQNQSVVLGSTSEMRCSAIESDSTLVWLFNGRNLTQSNRVRLHQNGWLRIEHVRNSDGGNYTCTIHSAGLAESRTARLEIVERPHQPEYITAELLDKLSTSVRIKWTAGFNGNSPITKYLVEMKTVNGEQAESLGADETSMGAGSSHWEVAKANISADQTSVIIADLKPARKYIFRIRAANRVGTGDPSLPTRTPIEVPVQPPSMAPESLSGTPRSSTSISLQWSPPPADSQNGLIKGYKIRHKLAGYASDTDWYLNDVTEPTRLNFVLDDLITWQNYEIQIAAENDKGVGPFSSSIFVRTKEGRPDKGPRNVQAEAVGPAVVKVNWIPPPPQHIYGTNQGYKVQIWYDAALSQLAKETVVAHNSLTPLQSATIDGLLAYTDYHVSVKCFTGAGDGVAQEESVSFKTKQDLPEAVASLEFADVLDKSLRVIWKPPRRVNGELNHYTLEYSEVSSTDKRILKKFPASITEARIVELSPQTAYTFKVYPHTDVGPGPGRTNQTTTSVPPVLPEPPSNLVPTNIGPYSAAIQFEPGFNGNAAIDRWIAEALVSSNGDYKPRWQTIYISTNHTQANSVVVRNLRPFTRYRIRLTPSNLVGSSRYPSEPTAEFQTRVAEPEQAPRDLSVEDVGPNSARVHWSPLTNNLWLGQPKGYKLAWSETQNSTISYQMINDTRADSLLVLDLEEFTEYTFKIYAVNEVGLSPPSEPVSIVTLESVPSAGPTNVSASAISSSSMNISWGPVPKRHRNGIIKGYKIQYQAAKANAALMSKTVEDNNTRHLVLSDLKPFTVYSVSVAAYTNAGEGVFSPTSSVQTIEDTPGLPQNLSSPFVSQTTARVLWDPPEDPNGDILGYKVTYHPLAAEPGNKDLVSQELHQNERIFKANNLKPETHYVFTVTAKTKEGWGQQASLILYTYDSELRANLPFFREGWFVILCACLSVVITIIVTALLFIQTNSYKYKQNAVKSSPSQDRLGDAGFTIDEDGANGHYNNGFGLLSNNAYHRRSNGALSQSTANFTLPKTPPRPHPGSIACSDGDDDEDDDDGDDDVFEDPVGKPPVRSLVGGVGGSIMNNGGAGTSRYDSSGDSLTEKPSEISSSPAPESPESNDDEYVNMANKHFVNHYANVNGTLRSQRSWRRIANGAAGPSGSSTSAKHYGVAQMNSRFANGKPKLPQRPAPLVPQVPVVANGATIDHLNGGNSSNGSENNATPATSRAPIASTSGQSSSRHYISLNQASSSSIYGESAKGQTHFNAPLHQKPQASTRVAPQSNGATVVDGLAPDSNNNNTIYAQQPKNGNHSGGVANSTAQSDLLNNHMINLNGGRIIVDNMAGSRAPLPGFTSFV